MGFRRQTYYRRKNGHRPEEVDEQIGELLLSYTGKYVAWGFWMIFHLLRREGYGWNHKRVYRIWKSLGLHLRIKPSRPKIRRKYQNLLAPEKINEGWAMDFMSDWVVGAGQQKVRIINIMDEGSRKAIWTDAHKNIPASVLIDILATLVQQRGAPRYIRCDNGPEFISKQLELWAKKHTIELKFIQPGKPTQNGLIERLNGTLRRECLNLSWFKDLEELRNELGQWNVTYNTIRPHESLKYKTPDEVENNGSMLYY